MGTLSIFRPRNFTGRLSAYKIYVDGKSVGSIDAGETLKVKIENGPRIIQARMAWCKSPVFRLESTPGSTHSLEVGGNPGNSKKTWARFFAAIVSPSTYLYIKHHTKTEKAW